MEMSKVLNKLVDTCLINENRLSLAYTCLVNSIMFI